MEALLKSVKKTNRLVVVTEACERGSVASDISAKVSSLAFDSLDAPVKIVAGLNTPIPYNSILEQASIPHKADIVKAVKEVLG
jgi:pyruvate/2-oxoglutarate/acetoin dehydrogenase E1 component